MSTVYVPEAGLDQEYKNLSTALEVSRESTSVGVVAYLKGPNGVDIPLPESVFNVLVNVVDAMKSGQGVSVVPMQARLTTQQAAEFLGVSRPTFIKLASVYETHLELVGRHRRILLQDLLALQQKIRVQRELALNEIIDSNNQEEIYLHDKELLPDKK